MVSLVDNEDFDVVSKFKWHAIGHGKRHAYAATKNPAVGSNNLMHRLILLPLRCQLVDHINGNTLDNRRQNLRLANKTQNGQNMRNGRNQQRGRYKGVHWSTERKKWVAQIKYDGKQRSLGRFNHAQEAALVYDHAARTHFGKFAVCNYPDES